MSILGGYLVCIGVVLGWVCLKLDVLGLFGFGFLAWSFWRVFRQI